MNLPKVVADMVLVKIIYSHNVDGGKFLIPNSGVSIHKYHSDYYGEVVDIGPDYSYELKKGDKVIFQRHEGKPIVIGDDEYLVLKERWVMGKYEE